jgi:arsenate reductase
MLTVYGLATCDRCREARHWLGRARIAFRFHDLRKDGVPEGALARWARTLGWERLLNRRSATWRGLDEAERAPLDEARALALMARHPALIARPVIEGTGPALLVSGFGAGEQRALTDWAKEHDDD